MTGSAATGSGAPDRERLEWAGLIPSRRLLDPDERVSEILYGLVMVVSITGTVSVATGGQGEVGTMLQAAIGSNLAWGITDAVMYLMSTLIQRGQAIFALREVQHATDDEVARSVISHLMPARVVAVLTPPELESIRRRLAGGPEPPDHPSLTGHDYLSALAIFALVFLSTFPVVIPFLWMDDAVRALRWSQGIALAMLFVLGWFTGRHVGGRPLRIGFLMVLLGVALIAIVTALGG
jgi:VIT1/CCC1 family predicted Fe2+/Mn2+ transporter